MVIKINNQHYILNTIPFADFIELSNPRQKTVYLLLISDFQRLVNGEISLKDVYVYEEIEKIDEIKEQN